MANWNPQTYLKFDQERLRPALDLLAQIPLDAPLRAVDLGCGPGNVTHILSERWPDCELIGIDSSKDMLEKAKSAYPHLAWQESDVHSWIAEEPLDLIFSNACLHWLDDHENLFPHLMRQLKSGGVLAVQVPNNFREPTHRLIADVLGHDHPLAPGFPVHEPAQYYDWLEPHCENINLWESRYMHILDGENPVADWTKGAALRPVLDGLESEAEKPAFEQDYRQRILKAYPKTKNGKTLLPFKRFFMVCVKK